MYLRICGTSVQVQGELFRSGDCSIDDDTAMEDSLVVWRPSLPVVSYVGTAPSKRETSAQTPCEPIEDHFFFQPSIDGRSNSYTTFLGEQIQFDLLAQPFVAMQAEVARETSWFSSVTAVAEGKPLTCSMGDVAFETLSKSLYVWHGSETAYHISKPMPFSCNTSSGDISMTYINSTCHM